MLDGLYSPIPLQKCVENKPIEIGTGYDCIIHDTVTKLPYDMKATSETQFTSVIDGISPKAIVIEGFFINIISEMVYECDIDINALVNELLKRLILDIECVPEVFIQRVNIDTPEFDPILINVTSAPVIK